MLQTRRINRWWWGWGKKKKEEKKKLKKSIDEGVDWLTAWLAARTAFLRLLTLRLDLFQEVIHIAKCSFE